MTTPTEAAVLRTVDKFDDVGPEGVMARLTTGLTDASGARIEGAGIHPIQAGAIVAFLDGRFGEGVDGMEGWFKYIGGRLQMMAALEQVPLAGGGTLLDKLIDMPQNEDNTWSETGRPQNIGWALDDLLEFVKSSKVDQP